MAETTTTLEIDATEAEPRPSVTAFIIDAMADRSILYGSSEHKGRKGLLPPQPAPQPYPCLRCELERKQRR